MNHSSDRCVRLAVFALVAFGTVPTARSQVFDYSLTVPGGQGNFGAAVSSLGDVNGDGCDDFVVGQPLAHTLSNYHGQVSVYSGKTGALLKLADGNPDSWFGYAVDGKIDADGDGYPDVLIGAPHDSTAAFEGGGVFIVSPHLNKFLLALYLNAPGGHFGSSVRSLEDDLDGDGIDDFIVGAPGFDTTYVISSATSTVIYTLTGQSGAGSGSSVSRAGDLDGDGFADFVVGSPDYVNGASNKTGRVVAFAGKDGSKLWSTDGVADSSFGYALAGPGDLDGDSFTDVVVGAPYHLDPGGIKTGCATVLSGASGSVFYKVFGDKNHDTFGISVRGASGDIDQDGTIDFIVGAPQRTGSDVGYARTISGATGHVLFTFHQDTNDPLNQTDYGCSVAGGDFDGDGRTDILIGGSDFNGGDGLAETWLTAVASWKNYGSGWPGTSGIPTLTATKNPVVGQTAKINLSNSAGVTTPGFLFLGLSKASIPTSKGGKLLVNQLLFISTPVPASGITLSGAIPDDPTLYGADLYLQAVEVDAGASKGYSFTQGLDLSFGYP